MGASTNTIQSIQEEISSILNSAIFRRYPTFVDLLKKNFLENNLFSKMISSQQEKAIQNFYIQLSTYVTLLKTQLEIRVLSTANTDLATSTITIDCIKQELPNNLKKIYSNFTKAEEEEMQRLHSQRKVLFHLAKISTGAFLFAVGLFIGFAFGGLPIGFTISGSFAVPFVILVVISLIAAIKYEDAYLNLKNKPTYNNTDYQQKDQALESLLKLTSSEALSANQQRLPPSSYSPLFASPPTMATSSTTTLPQPLPSQHHRSRSLSF